MVDPIPDVIERNMKTRKHNMCGELWRYKLPQGWGVVALVFFKVKPCQQSRNRQAMKKNGESQKKIRIIGVSVFVQGCVAFVFVFANTNTNTNTKTKMGIRIVGRCVCRYLSKVV